MKHEFSVIGVAETNTDPCSKDLFKIDNYCSFYQQIDPTKRKGTGVALYVHNSFTAVVDNSLSHCTKNLESLFVKINIGNETHTVGVIYNPPSGSDGVFIEELGLILEKCPVKNLHILGDFNFDLHKLENGPGKKFEELFLINNLFPTISLTTHAKPGCRKICIDNIFTNSPAMVTLSGKIETDISHHNSIFYITCIDQNKSDKAALTIHYDYSKSNTNLFIEKLEQAISKCSNNVSLQEFLDLYHTNFETCFKLKEPKVTKRNRISNPWITDGLITSIKQKEKLYNDWKDSHPGRIVITTV